MATTAAMITNGTGSPNVTLVQDVDDDGGLSLTMSYVYVIFTGVMSALSMLGCIVIFLTYAHFKDLRMTSRRLLVCLSMADFVTALGNFMGVMWVLFRYSSLEGNMAYCKAHSGMTVFSSISSYLWSVCIALYLYVALVKGKAELAETLSKLFHGVCWPIPGIVAIVALALDRLGLDRNTTHPSWCWIRSEVVEILLWQYVTGKAWEIAAWVIVTLLYILIIIHLKRHMKETEKLFASTSVKSRTRTNAINTANRRMTFIPAVFIFLRVWGTVRFLFGAHLEAYAGASASLWIVPLQGIGDSAQGFANAILFCALTSRVRRRILVVLGCMKPDTTRTMSYSDERTPAAARSVSLRLDEGEKKEEGREEPNSHI